MRVCHAAGEVAIGIDLGTTCSCFGIWQDGSVFASQLASCVAFTDTGTLIGDSAKKQAVDNPHNTVFDATRLIGRRFDDPHVQSDMKHWGHKVSVESLNVGFWP